MITVRATEKQITEITIVVPGDVAAGIAQAIYAARDTSVLKNLDSTMLAQLDAVAADITELVA